MRNTAHYFQQNRSASISVSKQRICGIQKGIQPGQSRGHDAGHSLLGGIQGRSSKPLCLVAIGKQVHQGLVPVPIQWKQYSGWLPGTLPL
jgi:hypothetical protein